MKKKFQSERAGGLSICLFVPANTPRPTHSLHPWRPHCWAADPSPARQQAGSGEEGRKQAWEGWKCLSEQLNDAIWQKHSPPRPYTHTHTHSSITSPNPPPNPACSSGDITSLRSNMAENSCRAACGCWKFFPTAVTVLEAVTGAAEIRDSNSLLSVENSRLGDENPVVTNLDLKEGKQNETDL